MKDKELYSPESIKALAKEYIKTQDDKTFEKLLLTDISSLIDSQLAKFYSSKKSFWQDMKQDVYLMLWENRRDLKKTKFRKLDQLFYFTIKRLLERSCKRIVGQYDCFNPEIAQGEDPDEISEYI